MSKFFLFVYFILNIALITVVFFVLDRYFGIKVINKIKESFYKIPKSQETVEKIKPILGNIKLPDFKAVFDKIKPKPKPIKATVNVKNDISEYVNNKPTESIITHKTQSEHPGFGRIGSNVSDFNRGTSESDLIHRNQSNMEEEQRLAIRREAMQKEAEKREALHREAMRKEAEQREALKREALRKEAEQREALKREALRKEAEQREALEREALRKEAEQSEYLQKEALQKEALQKEADKREALKREVLRKEAEKREALKREALRKETEQKEALQREVLHRETVERESVQTVYGLASGDDTAINNSRYVVADTSSDSRVSSSMSYMSEDRSDDGNNRFVHNYNKNEIYGNEGRYNGLGYYDEDSNIGNDNTFNRNNGVLVSGLRLENEQKKPSIKEIFKRNGEKRDINDNSKRGKKANKIASTGYASLFFNNSNGLIIIPYAKDMDGKGRAMDGIVMMQSPFETEELAYSLSSTINIDKETNVFTDKELVKRLGTKEWKDFTSGKRYISVRYEEDCGLIFNTTSRNPDGSYRLNCPGGIEKIVNMDTSIDELEEVIMNLLEKCRA